MKVKELIAKLQKFEGDAEVMYRDSIAPCDLGAVYPYAIQQSDEDNSGDCDGRVGECIVAIG